MVSCVGCFGHDGHDKRIAPADIDFNFDGKRFDALNRGGTNPGEQWGKAARRCKPDIPLCVFLFDVIAVVGAAPLHRHGAQEARRAESGIDLHPSRSC